MISSRVYISSIKNISCFFLPLYKSSTELLYSKCYLKIKIKVYGEINVFASNFFNKYS